MTIFVRSGRWVLRKVGGYSLVALTLLVIIAASIAQGFSILVRGIAFDPLFWLGFFGVLLGWWFAHIRFPGWLGWTILLVFGGGFTLVIVGELYAPMLYLTRTAIRFAWDHLLTLGEDVFIDPKFLQLAYGEVVSGSQSTLTLFISWFRSLIAGDPLYNTVAVSLVWGMGLWMLAAFMGWIQRRYAITLLAVLPAGVLLASGLSYTRSEMVMLYPFMVASLFLLALTSYHQREKSWQERRLDFPEDPRMDLSMIVVGLTFFLFSFALVVPRFSIRAIVDFARQFTQPQIEQADRVFESFGLQQKADRAGRFQSVLTGGMPRSHLLGAGPELSEQVVMSVRITGGMDAYVIQDLQLPLYWRALTYDVYSGDGWRTSEAEFEVYQSGEILLEDDLPFYRVLQQDVHVIEDRGDLVFAAGELVTLNKDYRVARRPTPEANPLGQISLDVMGATTNADNYRLQSMIPFVGEEDLRAAPINYPAWIADRYLSLPESIPGRVSRLAEELTADRKTPYDQAKAIEAYLRTYEYNLDVIQPPQRFDVVDFFLFENRRGYCDYFASAMVVLARSVGIPSRLAVGYVTGTFDQANQRYFVTEAEAHSWVEVYFPSIGWVPFEPTSGRPVIDRPHQIGLIPQTDDSGLDTLIPWWQLAIGDWREALIRIPLVILLLIVLWFSLDGWWLRQFPSAQTVDRLYRRLYRHGKRLRVPASRGETPYEFAANLEARLLSLGAGTKSEDNLVLAVREIQALTDIYAQIRYSGQPSTVDYQLKAIEIWLRLRVRLFSARWAQFLSRF